MSVIVAPPNLVRHAGAIAKNERAQRYGHRGVVVWLTGLSGSGKSTLAHELERRLFDANCLVTALDGDNVRHGLCSDLGFSVADRQENIRRIGEMAKLFAEAGHIVVTAFISPFHEDRERVRGLLPHGDFFEVFIECPLAVCEARDVKGFYRRARAGEIAGYTGIDSPYEVPARPELVLNTAEFSIAECVEKLLLLLRDSGVLHRIQEQAWET